MSWITNIGPIREFISFSRRRRADFLMCSDSNTVFGGHGQDHGITRALAQHSRLYRTGLLSHNENGGLGSQTGYYYQHTSNGARAFTTPIASVAAYDDILPAGNSFTPHDYWHMTDAQSDAGNNGMFVAAGGPFNVNDAMRYRTTWHTFNVGATGAVRPAIRRGSAPYTNLATNGADIETVTGALTAVDHTLSIAAGTRDYPIDGRLIQAGVTGQGPIFATWQHFDWPNITAGLSFNVIGYYGGQGLRNFYNYQQATQTAWDEYFRQLTIAQGVNPKACIIISSGLNDRGDAAASIGPVGGLNSSTQAGYADNLRGLINFYKDKWAVAAYDEEDLYFLLICSHPVSSPDDSQLVSYREACATMCSEYQNTTAIDMSQYNAQLQANAATWYDGGGTPHMTQTGYEEFYELVFRGLFEEIDGASSFRSRGGSRGRLLWGVR